MNARSTNRRGRSAQAALGLTARIVVLVCAVLGLAPAAIGGELVIADQERSDYCIVVAVNATMQDGYAARMLKRYIHEMSGSDLTITPDTAPVIEHEIVVGVATQRCAGSAQRDTLTTAAHQPQPTRSA